MSLLFDLWLVNRLLSGALDDIMVGEAAMTGDDFGFYSLLRRFGPVTPTQVARWTAMPPTTVSAAVRRLQGRGHAELRPNPADGRSRLVALTPAGEKAHAEAAEVFFAATRPLAAAIGADEARQRASLQRLDRALRAVGGLDPRPYDIDARDDARHTVEYDGPPLSAEEQDHVRRYVDFVRAGRSS
jgi:DNA-binding MarR family transcriptional regulator